jgi:hypothetical protein
MGEIISAYEYRFVKHEGKGPLERQGRVLEDDINTFFCYDFCCSLNVIVLNSRMSYSSGDNVTFLLQVGIK